MRRHLSLLCALLLLAALAVLAAPAAPASGSQTQLGDFRVYVPTIFGVPPLPPVDWDPRLDVRGTVIIPADVQPGQGYWRLVKGVWYGPDEPPFAGQHHIFVDTLNQAGERQPGVPVEIRSVDKTILWQTIITEEKRGDLYAANFPMYNLAPSYWAMPTDGNPADAVSGMGLGSIEHPEYAYHVSYGFVWQWTIAP